MFMQVRPPNPLRGWNRLLYRGFLPVWVSFSTADSAWAGTGDHPTWVWLGLLGWLGLIAVGAWAALLFFRRRRDLPGPQSRSERNPADDFPFGVYRVVQNKTGSADFSMISERALQLLGITRKEASLENGQVFRHVHDDDRDALIQAELHAREIGGRLCHESRFLVDGRLRWLRLEDRPSRIGSRWIRDGWIMDVTEQRVAASELEISEARFRRVLQDIDGVAVQGYRPDGSVTYWNLASERLYGYSADEARQSNLLDLIIPPEMRDGVRSNMAGVGEGRPIPNGEIELMRKDGSRVSVYSSHTALNYSSGEVELFCIDIDLTEQKKNERALERIANYDLLTGLPNRRLMSERLARMAHRSGPAGMGFALCYLDLDDFKQINDRHGHATGDQVLVAVAERLRKLVRGTDLVGRLGGDEFLVALDGLSNGHELERQLIAIQNAISHPVEVDELRLRLRCSIGVTIFPQDSADPDILLRHADQAMYRSKSMGRNRYSLFDIDLESKTRQRRRNLAELEKGLDRGQLELFYQPKIDLEDGRVAGFEGLIRWRHPERGLLAPAAFLPWLDNTELEQPFGDYVLCRALDDLERWQSDGMDIAVSVNVSGPHLLSEGFVERLRTLLGERTRPCAELLSLEILESAAVSDLDLAVAVLEEIRALGIKVALDDFGTGYSSLRYLRSLPVDEVKVDQSFVMDMLTDRNDRQIVRSVVGLAAAFDLRAVAEGVETTEHLVALRALGCRFGQGYVFARPMPAEQVKSWLAEGSAYAVWSKSSRSGF
jgi:diguanylate cyclase (GGDEF)-like protein/PAS domain S-box-containing protein